MNQRVHVVSPDATHWAREKEACPDCHTGKGFRCIDLNTRTISLPNNTVHVARVKANGCNVRM